MERELLRKVEIIGKTGRGKNKEREREEERQGEAKKRKGLRRGRQEVRRQ